MVTKMKTSSKVIITILVLIVAFAVAWPLFLSDLVTAQVIRQQLDKRLSAVKNGDVTMIEDMIGDDDAFLETIGVDSTELYTAYFEGFDYKILDVTAKDDTATAVCEITMKDATATLDSATDTLIASIKEGSFFEGDDTDYLAMAGDIFLDGVRSSAEYSTSTVEIRFAKVEGTWQIVNEEEIIEDLGLGGDMGTRLNESMERVQGAIEDALEKPMNLLELLLNLLS